MYIPKDKNVNQTIKKQEIDKFINNSSTIKEFPFSHNKTTIISTKDNTKYNQYFENEFKFTTEMDNSKDSFRSLDYRNKNNKII